MMERAISSPHSAMRKKLWQPFRPVWPNRAGRKIIHNNSRAPYARLYYITDFADLEMISRIELRSACGRFADLEMISWIELRCALQQVLRIRIWIKVLHRWDRLNIKFPSL